MSNMFELKNEYLMLQQMALDDEIDPQAIADTLEGVEGEIGEKLDSASYIVSMIDGKIASIEKEEARLAKYKDAMQINRDSLVKKMASLVDALPEQKMETELHKYYYKKNPASAVIDDESKIPMEYWKPQPAKVDKQSISKYLKSLKDGETCEFAHLEQGRTFKF